MHAGASEGIIAGKSGGISRAMLATDRPSCFHVTRNSAVGSVVMQGSRDSDGEMLQHLSSPLHSPLSPTPSQHRRRTRSVRKGRRNQSAGCMPALNGRTLRRLVALTTAALASPTAAAAAAAAKPCLRASVRPSFTRPIDPHSVN